MNHKRGRPKNQRAGCLMCKPHKGNGSKGRRSFQTVQERKAREATSNMLAEMNARAEIEAAEEAELREHRHARWRVRE